MGKAYFPRRESDKHSSKWWDSKNIIKQRPNFKRLIQKDTRLKRLKTCWKGFFFLIFFFTLKFETLQGVAILRLIINCIVIFKKKCKYNKKY